MKRLISLWLIVTTMVACKPRLTDERKEENKAAFSISPEIADSGVQISFDELKQCSYPTDDPLFEKKWNKKLLLVRVTLFCREGVQKETLVPEGALLTDSKGNEYEASPAIIAMAQNNKCISGDDIKAYNAIWNGEIKKGDRYTAWVLGFEVPEDALPEKLYWNTGWKKDQLFFSINNYQTAVNH